jgi:predicted nucleotidyltransferase
MEIQAILGPIKNVALLLRTNPVDEVIIAMPSAGIERLKELYSILKKKSKKYESSRYFTNC